MIDFSLYILHFEFRLMTHVQNECSLEFFHLKSESLFKTLGLRRIFCHKRTSGVRCIVSIALVLLSVLVGLEALVVLMVLVVLKILVVLIAIKVLKALKMIMTLMVLLAFVMFIAFIVLTYTKENTTKDRGMC